MLSGGGLGFCVYGSVLAGPVSCRVTDGGDQESEVPVVEAGDRVAEVNGGSGGDAGGEPEDASLAAAGRKVSRVQGGDRGFP